MQINLSFNFEKRHLVFLVVLVCILFVAGVAAYQSSYNNPAIMGHSDNEIMNVSAGKVLPGTFGGTSSDTFGFLGNLNVGKSLVLPETLPNSISWGTKASISYNPSGAWAGLQIYPGSSYLSVVFPNSNITSENITATKTITLGGVPRTTWPSGNIVAGGYLGKNGVTQNCETDFSLNYATYAPRIPGITDSWGGATFVAASCNAGGGCFYNLVCPANSKIKLVGEFEYRYAMTHSPWTVTVTPYCIYSCIST